MVMVTRSARRNACEIFDDSRNSSDMSCNVPPWCSSGRACERRPRKIPTPICDIRSPFVLRSNFWKIPSQDKSVQNSSCSKKRKIKTCRVKQRDNIGKCRVLLFLLCALAGGVIVWFWRYQNINLNTRKEIISLFGLDQTSVAIDEECCHKMKQLAAALLLAEQTLRRARRHHTLMLTSHSGKIETPSTSFEPDLIADVEATKSGGEEWGGRAALWGIVPLWRSSPPPQVLLDTSAPAPGDCWPFSGSQGEVTFQWRETRRVRRVSVQHVRPDAARSAPHHFALYGILENGTWVSGMYGQYTYEGPAKQFFTLRPEFPPVKQVAFRVMSNHGNTKYTCVYRVHIYNK
ncbi:SUN domain-containing protein 5 [Plutella xylostella]|uniref:SUN domain-containing protein 5 n=1 Tax=Plutella xylostella TaxID=51655 RepID=UPI0020324730|nr:SUN domain-containing protein 5 [Plutella xylostella]